MVNKIFALINSGLMALAIYQLCEAKLSIGIAVAFFLLCLFVLLNYNESNKDV